MLEDTKLADLPATVCKWGNLKVRFETRTDLHYRSRRLGSWSHFFLASHYTLLNIEEGENVQTFCAYMTWV